MKKKIISCVSVLSTALLLAACNGSAPAPEKKDYISINEFDSDNDFLKFRKTNKDSTGNVDYRLNKNKDYIVSGAGSLKYTVYEECENYLIFPFVEDSTSLFDVSELHFFNFSIYSDSSETLEGKVSLYGTSRDYLSYNFTVNPKSWTNVEFKVSSLLIESVSSLIQGAKVSINAPDNYVSYIDEVRVKLGSEMDPEEQAIKDAVDVLNSKIAALPEVVTANDYEAIKECYDLYNLIPENYKVLVTNSDLIFTKLQELATNVPTSLEVKNGQELLGFDKLYGTSQIFVNGSTQTAGTKIEYVTDFAYEGEDASTRVKFVENEYTYLNLLYSPAFRNYDTVTIHIYNESTSGFAKRVYFNEWKKYYDLPANEWSEITLKVSEFFGGPLAITEIDEKGHASVCTGSFYFSKATGYLKQYSAIGLLLDENIPAFVSGIDSSLTVLEHNGFKVTANEEGICNIRFNKAILEIEDEDNVYLVINVSEDLTLKLLGFDGNDIKTISLRSGNNKIELNAKEYSLVFALEATLNQNTTLSVTSFFTYEASVKDAAYIIASYQSLPKASDVDENTICSVIEFIEKYELLDDDNKDLVKEFESDIDTIITAYQEALVQGDSLSLLNKYIKGLLDEFDTSSATPYLLLSLGSLEFVHSNVSSENKEKLDALFAMYDICFGKNSDEIYRGYDFPWTGNISRYIDSRYGNVYGFDVSSYTGTSIQLELGKFKDVEEYASLSFELYNPTNNAKQCQFYTQEGSVWVMVTSFTIKPKSWQHVELDASRVNNPRNFILIGNDSPTSGYVMSSIVGVKKSAKVGKIINEISKLPTTIEDSDKLSKITVLSLMDEYNNLTEELKELITNHAKLESLYNTYCNKISIAIKAGSSSYIGLLNAGLDNYTSENKGYGSYASSSLTTDAPDKTHHGFLTVDNTLLKKLANDYDHVCFYIYVPTDCPNPNFFCQYSIGWHGLNTNLIAGEWNEIVLSGNEFFDEKDDHSGMMFFYVNGRTNNLGAGEWKITSFYGYND